MKIADIEQIVDFKYTVEWKAWIHVENKTGAPRFVTDTAIYLYTGSTLWNARINALRKLGELVLEIRSGTPKLYPTCKYREPNSPIIPFVSITAAIHIFMELHVYVKFSEAAIINACVGRYDPFRFSNLTDSEVDDNQEFEDEILRHF